MAVGGKADCCPGNCTLKDLIGVGRHPAGKAPSGAEDLLVTQAELIALSRAAAQPVGARGSVGEPSVRRGP